MTENHNYNTPQEGAVDWHLPLNENFRQLDVDIELRDVESNLSNYTPAAGSKFFATDTERVFIGDGNGWQALSSFGRSPTLDAVRASAAYFGPGLKEAFPQSVEDQIVAAGPGLSDTVQYFDSVDDFGQALNDAWAALENGGWVLLPAGSYAGSTTIVPQNSGVHILGQGANASQNGQFTSHVGTEYRYEGTGAGFSIAPISTGYAHVTVENLLLRNTGSGTIGVELGNTGDQGGDVQKLELSTFRNVSANDWTADGWLVEGSFFNSQCDWIGGFDNGGRGFVTTGPPSYLSLSGNFAGNQGWGVELGAGGDFDAFVRADNNGLADTGDGGVYVGSCSGHFVLSAERNRGTGVRLASQTSGEFYIGCLKNDQRGAGDFEVQIDETNSVFINGAIEVRDGSPEAIASYGKGTVTFGGIRVNNEGTETPFYSLNNGLDWTFTGALPDGLVHNQLRAASCDDSGTIQLPLDTAYSDLPEVDVNVTEVTNKPSDASLSYPTIAPTRDADGDVTAVAVQFEWTDGSGPGAGDIIADVSCRTR